MEDIPCTVLKLYTSKQRTTNRRTFAIANRYSTDNIHKFGTCSF